MKLTLFAVCAISAVAVRLESQDWQGTAETIFNNADKTRDGLLSKSEIEDTMKKGIAAGVTPPEAQSAMMEAVAYNASNKGDPAAKSAVCDQTCFMASLDQTFKKLDVQDDERVKVL